MKKKEINELKHRSPEDLARLTKESGEKLRALKFDLAAGKVKDINPIRAVRKDIARMKTFIRQSEMNKKPQP